MDCDKCGHKPWLGCGNDGCPWTATANRRLGVMEISKEQFWHAYGLAVAAAVRNKEAMKLHEMMNKALGLDASEVRGFIDDLIFAENEVPQIDDFDEALKKEGIIVEREGE